MKFGIFDQNDRGGLELAQQYEQRIRLVQLYDELGFHCYHMSEHHITPLSTTPSQGVFLSALIQRTSRLRFCPLVYLLPVHHPLRLAEEICMLDHLSHGRFEFGIGRGASPHELEALGVDAAAAAAMYAEAFRILEAYFTEESLTFAGRYWSFHDVPVEMRPYQRPHPPLWYALASPDSTVWPAQRGANIVCGGPVARIRAITDRYRAEWAVAHPEGGPLPLIGVNRYIIVAETDREAQALGRAAWPVFYRNFMKLWHKHGTQPVNAKLPPEFDALLESRQAVAGTAETVRAELARQIAEGGLNYLIGSFMFGSLAHADARASVRLFAEQVAPALRAAEVVAA
ncbi:LLM class flavin-dependent oxidoreductase [Siccirubricoccus phaeus]|uniref:LLM class flavin-dependent oxidoreductase n=1 Tax=Siccirubricoccus phaeus TaxID=2595053 RepID=UPI0011F18DF9|nr:LLM class flavin-dependent oxidoreductase [Siccirubricoccus phaeus]